MIVDASVLIDAVADPGPRGMAARAVLAAQPAADPLVAPGHLAVDVICGLRAAADRPDHPLAAGEVPQALLDAESFEIVIEATPWADIHRASTLAGGGLPYSQAVYVAAAERHGTALLTSDARLARLARSGVPVRCPIVTVDRGGTTHH